MITNGITKSIIMAKQPFSPGDRVGILHKGADTGKRGIVREVTNEGQLIVDPEPGPDDNGHPYFDDEELFFSCA